jgi:DNA-binding FadR family transcriptional regulator
MAKATTERMAAYRMRQRIAGFTTLSVIVPAEDAALFQQFAAERRGLKSQAVARRPLRKHWFSVIDQKPIAPAPETVKPRAPRNGDGRTRSRAEALAEEMLKGIIHLGWPVGRPLGSETELMQQHNVSRTVLRQAIRLLEHHSIAHMQRGAAGGLVVGAPDPAATTRAVSIYLEYQRIGPIDILETRRILEEATVTLATERLSTQGEDRLRADIAAESTLDGNAPAEALQRFHFTLAELSGDPALRLFAGIVLNLSDAHSNFTRRSREDRDKVVRRIRKLHSDIADAVIARNAETARRLVRRYLEGYKGWME